MCYNTHTDKWYFGVEIVLLRTLWVKRNVGRGTPTKIPEIQIGRFGDEAPLL